MSSHDSGGGGVWLVSGFYPHYSAGGGVWPVGGFLDSVGGGVWPVNGFFPRDSEGGGAWPFFSVAAAGLYSPLAVSVNTRRDLVLGDAVSERALGAPGRRAEPAGGLLV